MKRTTFVTILACAPLVSGCASDAASALVRPPSPQAQIQTRTTAFVAAWNVHDASAFALNFTPGASFTNVFGVHVQGRPAIEKFHAGVFATVFKNSHQSADVIDIIAVSQSDATVHVSWSMTGATVPGWPPVQHGVISWTLEPQTDGSWLIAVMTNAVTPATS